MQILIVDDDKSLCRSLQIHLERMKHDVTTVNRAAEGLQSIENVKPDLVFLDLELPDQRGVEILKDISGLNETVLVVMITGVQDTKATIEAIRDGAFDYIRKPLDLDAITVSITKAEQFFQRRQARETVKIAAKSTDPFEIVGRDSKIIAVLKRIGTYSRNNTPVLIEGESGTGKELVARALHASSTPDKPFVAVNCSAIVATLLESELFGHDKGSFTGAVSEKPGKFELAADGTIFLDEVGDMPLELQAKLLRALQERRFERVGGTKSLTMRARVVSATNQDLKDRVSKNVFREDLYYRLAVSVVRIPPLRARPDDIAAIAKHLVNLHNQTLDTPIDEIESAALTELRLHNWPGNVRQLNNVMIRAAAMAQGSTITLHDLREALAEESIRPEQAHDSDLSLQAAEKRHIAAILNRENWNISRTARILGVTRVTLRNKIAALQIVRPEAFPASDDERSAVDD